MGVHFIIKCEACDRIITQCRCPSADKTVSYARCSSCNRTYGHEEEPVALPPNDIKVNVIPEVSPENMAILERAVNDAVRIGVVSALRELADELEKDDE